MTKSNAQRQREFMERKRAGVENPKCKYCYALLKSEKTKATLVCSNCFPSTLEGIEANRLRQIKHVKKKKREKLKTNERIN
jgi:hypothetical protein